MREILELAVSLDETAARVYADLSESCTDDDLKHVFKLMAREEQEHVSWWSELLVAWKDGLIPDIADEHDLASRLRQIETEVLSALPADCTTLSTNQMLDLAAHLEFYMLDPVFGELTDLMQPGGKIEVREAYSRHVLRVVGAIERHHTESGLASFLARVLTRAYRDQQRLAALAMRDQLTGLYNRRGLLQHLSQWLSWSERYNRPVGIALIDVDYFKAINDSWGHPAGDEALLKISEAIQSAVRTSDVVGRFGGDEFMVLAPESDDAELTALMERIVEAVRSTPLVARGSTRAVSVSVGGSWAPGGVKVLSETLIAAADRSLYTAKGAGRDRAAAPLSSAQPVA
jgi:diguanylate cyclase (GGDEF)-like protein